MGRKNNNARDLSVKERRTLTPSQLKRDAEKARWLIHEVGKPHSTPEAFTHKVSASVSAGVIAELRAVYSK